MAKFLDDSGLRVLWGLIKGGFVQKSSVSEKSTSLTWNTETEIANIDGKSIKVKIPAAPTFSNTARLQVSDTTNRRINTKESTGNYIQFTGGTNKFTVGDGTSSFDVSVTPSISLAHTITVKSGVKKDGSTEITSTSPSADNPTVSLGDSGVTAGIYGPSADVSGSNGNTIKVPQIRVNAKGIVTEISEKTYTSVDTNTHNSHGHTFITTTPTSIGTTLGWGGTFDVVTALGNASATSGNLSSTYTTYRFQLPGNPNTDSKVTQTPTTSSNTSWRPLILGGGNNYSDATVFAPVNVTDGVLASHLAKFAPSQGIMALVGLKKLGTDGKEVAGSNTTVWNTNGGTTSLNSYLTSQDHYKTSPTAGYYGPDADVTGSNGSTVSIPHIEVDANGHIKSISNKTFTAVNSTYTVNNAALSLQVNGASKTTFYANDSTNKTFNIASGTSSSGNGTFLAGGVAVSIYGLASGAYKAVDAESMTASSTNLPTSKAVAAFVSAALTSVLSYKGTIGSSGATVTSLPASHKVGDTYVVSTAGTYAGKACEVGDYIICRTAGSSANDSHWDVINGENQVENKSASLAGAGNSATIATVDGTNLTITTPSTWTGVSKTGTVTSVATGAGLTGGTITGSGTIKVKLKDETANTADSSKSTSGDGGLYAVEVDKSGNLAVRVPWTDHTYTVNNGTLSLQANGTTKTTFTANQSGNSTFNIATGSANGTIAVAGVDVSVKGLGSAAYTDSTAYAAASHSHSYVPSSTTSSIGLDPGSNYIGYVGSLTKAAWNYNQSDGAMYTQFYSSSWKHEIFADYRTGHMSVRGKNNGTWQNWYSVFDMGNVTAGTNVSISQNSTTGQITISSAYTNTAKLKVSDTTNKRIANTENTGNYVQFTGGSNKFTVSDGTNSFEVPITISGYAASGHTHTTTIAADSGTSALNMAANTTYKLTAGGTTFIFKTPADSNTWRGIQDNLTSSSNTTESLSAKQGYLLANGSARDNTKLPLSGGTMTGSIVPNSSSTIDFGSSTAKWHYIYAHRIVNVQSICNGTTYDSNQLLLPNKSGTIAVTSDIPTVNNGTLNFQASGTTKATFTANQSGTSNFNIATGSTNGTISVGGTDVAVKGLGSAAYTDSGSYATSGHTHNYAGSDSAGGPANTVKGAYTSNGGQQGPGYFGRNKVGFLMMNTTVNGNSHYKDWAIMDCYSGNDVGGSVAIGVNRQALGAYIMRSAAERSSWAESAELIGTHNYTTYCATAGHTHSTSISTSSASNQITLAFGTKYVITAGGTSYVFTMPGNPNTNTWRPIQVGGTDKLTDSSTKLNFASSGSASVSYSGGTITIGCSAAANATADSALTAAEVEALLT